MLNKNFRLFSLLFIVIIGFIIYSNSFDGEFLFDDSVQIVNQDNIKDLDRFTHLSTWTNINDRPLSVYSLALNYQWGGLNVFGYHLFNTIIHIFSSCFVFLICRIILQRFNNNVVRNEYKPWFALFCALIFLTHPIQTQSVSYIIQRMTSLAGMFYLISVYFYLKTRLSYFKDSNIYKIILFFILCVGSTLAAILSKQNAVSIVFAFILVEFFFVRNKNGWINKRIIIAAIITLLLFIIFYGFAFGLPKETEEISRTSYLFTQFRVILKYFQLLIFPISQNLDYDFALSYKWYESSVLFSLSVLLGILYVAYKTRHRLPLLSFGVLWIFISLSVESSIIPITDVIFEHRLYLANFGFGLIVCSLLFKYLSSNKKILYSSLIAIIVILSSLTLARNQVWQTPFDLWTDVVKKSPQKSRPNLNLGIAHFKNTKPLLALKSFDRAIKLKPVSWLAYFNRAETYLLMGNLEKSKIDLDRCIYLNNKFALSYDSRGVVKTQLGEYESAMQDFNIAIELDPELATAWLNRANAKVHLKLFNDAFVDYNQALSLNSDFKEALNNRAQLYIYYKKYELAYRDLIKAIELDPNFVQVYNNLAKVFISMKEYEMAVDYLNKSIKLYDQNYKIYVIRAGCYIKLEEHKLALNDLNKCRELGGLIDLELIESLRRKINEKL